MFKSLPCFLVQYCDHICNARQWETYECSAWKMPSKGNAKVPGGIHKH